MLLKSTTGIGLVRAPFWIQKFGKYTQRGRDITFTFSSTLRFFCCSTFNSDTNFTRSTAFSILASRCFFINWPTANRLYGLRGGIPPGVKDKNHIKSPFVREEPIEKVLPFNSVLHQNKESLWKTKNIRFLPICSWIRISSSSIRILLNQKLYRRWS